MDRSWDVTLLEFIPQFLNALDSANYHTAVNKLATCLKDGHGYTSVTPLYNQFSFKYIMLIDSKTVIRTPPEGSTLLRGDIILNINGKDILMVRDSIAALIPSSNLLFTNYAVNGWIYVSIFLGCNLIVMRNEQIMTICEERKTFSWSIDTIPSYFTISSDISYVNLEKLQESEITRMMDNLNNFRGIIFDLRNYPQNFHACNLLLYISEMSEYMNGLATRVDFSHCGAFFQTEYIQKCPDELGQEQNKFKGKIVVLVNAATMSKAEVWAMMFRAYGATLIGTPTAGANGRLISFPIPGGIIASYSGLGFYYPDGTQTQRTGIIPDIEVYPTMDDIMAGRDEVLEAAITFLNSN